MFGVFSLVETPLGKGDLFGADARLLDTARLEILSGDLPARYSTAGSKQRHTSSIEVFHAAATAYAIEPAGGGPALPPQACTTEREFETAKHATLAVPAFIGCDRASYSPRAPPAHI